LYSARRPLPADLADGFFILFSFAPARAPGADDADIITPFCMHHNQQFVQMRPSQNDETIFGL